MAPPRISRSFVRLKEISNSSAARFVRRAEREPRRMINMFHAIRKTAVVWLCALGLICAACSSTTTEATAPASSTAEATSTTTEPAAVPEESGDLFAPAGVNSWQLVGTVGESVRHLATGPNGVLAVGRFGDAEQFGVAFSDDPALATWTQLPVDAFGEVSWKAAYETRHDNEEAISWNSAHADSTGYTIVSEAQTWDSADGTTWTGPFANPPGISLDSIVGNSDGGVLASGVTDDGAIKVFAREAGSDWTLAWEQAATPGVETSIEQIASGPSGYVGVGWQYDTEDPLEDRHPLVITSSDGSSWQAVEVAGDFDGRGGLFTSIAWSPAQDAWVAAGWDGVGGQEQRALVFTSADGTAWAQTTDPLLDVPLYSDKMEAVVATGSGVVAAGFDEYAPTPFGILWTLNTEGTWTSNTVVEAESEATYFWTATGTGSDVCLVAGEYTGRIILQRSGIELALNSYMIT